MDNRTLLELLLVVFLFWYFLSKKSRPGEASMVKLTEKVTAHASCKIFRSLNHLEMTGNTRAD
jgi:hypothetical protein